MPHPSSPIEFDDGVQIHVIENEKSVRLLILHVEPVKPMEVSYGTDIGRDR